MATTFKLVILSTLLLATGIQAYEMVFSNQTIPDLVAGAIDVAKLITSDWLALPLGGSCGLAAKYITPHVFSTSAARGTLHTTFEYLTQDCTAEFKHDINTCALLNADFAVCLGFPFDARTSHSPWGYCSNQNSRVSYLWIPENATTTMPLPPQKSSDTDRGNLLQVPPWLTPLLPSPPPPLPPPPTLPRSPPSSLSPPVCLSHGLPNKTAMNPEALANLFKDHVTLSRMDSRVQTLRRMDSRAETMNSVAETMNSVAETMDSRAETMNSRNETLERMDSGVGGENARDQTLALREKTLGRKVSTDETMNSGAETMDSRDRTLESQDRNMNSRAKALGRMGSRAGTVSPRSETLGRTDSRAQTTDPRVNPLATPSSTPSCDWRHSNIIPVAWDGVQNVLMAGQSLQSPDGTYALTMQYDCNLVVYKRRPDGTTEWNAKWASFSQFDDPFQRLCYLEMQPDGMLVVKDPLGAPRWSSGAAAPSLYSSALSVISCGNVIVLDMTSGAVVWATHTGHS